MGVGTLFGVNWPNGTGATLELGIYVALFLHLVTIPMAPVIRDNPTHGNGRPGVRRNYDSSGNWSHWGRQRRHVMSWTVINRASLFSTQV